MPSLVCDITYRPVGLIPTRDAVSRVVVGEATTLIEDPERVFRSPSLTVPAPLIIQVPVVVPLSRMEKAYPSRRVIFARDNYRCQYCNVELGRREATIDHVKPRSRFAHPSEAHTWDNLVTCCQPCNRRKADRLPMECGMYPMRAPREPNYIAARWLGRLSHEVHIAHVAQMLKLEPSQLRRRGH